MDIYLARLQQKPIPNIKNKDGVQVFFSKTELVSPEVDENLIERDEDGEIVADYNETDKQEVKKSLCKIQDGRKESKLDRELIMKILSENHVFHVSRKHLPQQSPELAETVVPPDEDVSEKITKTLQFEIESDEEEVEEPEEDVEEPQKKGKKTVVIKRKRKEPQEEEIVMGDVNPDTVIADATVKTRIPKKYQHRLKTSTFYMNNRKKFIQQLAPMFDIYKKELTQGQKVASKEDGFSPMIHQRVISDYLNLYTPYRGLLLYHGLGAGKTCGSIGIAEGFKSQKKVFVMTLASLKANFFNQLKECGDPLYRLNQYWEFVSIEGKPDYIPLLSNILSIPKEVIKKRKGAWMVNVSKEANFEDLSDEDKKSLNEQIDIMIRSKYIDVNYNGLTETNIDSKLKLQQGEFKKGNKNPFDNSVVVVDEVHNLVSMIVNKMNEKKSISYLLYQYLMSASNARIVLLSGTPIINYPNEIGILFNILRGHIKTWNFPVKITSGAKKPTRDNIVQWFEDEGLSTFDFVDYSGDNVTVTRNPFGFINKTVHKKKYGGASKSTKKNRHLSKKNTRKHREVIETENGLAKIIDRNPESILDETDEKRKMRINALFETQKGGSFEDYRGVVLDETGNISDADFKKIVVKALKKHGLETALPSKIKHIGHKALPDNSKEFLDKFVELDSSEMKNKDVFQKRILGLTSYIKGVDDDLYPSYISSEHDKVFHIERVPMSQYQFTLYEKIREEESKQEKRTKQQMSKQNAEELFKTSSTYKIASRLCCNFAFPDPPGRPKKNTGELIGKEDIGDFEYDEPKKGGAGDDPKQKKLQVLGNVVLEDIDVLDAEKEVEQKVEEEKEVEEEEKEVEEAEEKEVEVVEKEVEEAEEKEVEVVEEEEKAPIEEFKVKVAKKKPKDFGKQVAEVLMELNSRKEEVFSPAGLKTYSPKFLKILKNLTSTDNIGLHLIYTQFRTLEGVSLLKYVLDANGFAEFKIQKIPNSSDWEIVEDEKDKGKLKYALHTGTETDEEKKILLNIYNSNWGEVPSSIVNKLQEEDKENNFMGECIKILMITASGAEGINLKNTRFVHIVEPYWNMVRLEQVIGRARRIASHMSLPEDLRTVKVFLYMSVIPQDILTSDKHKSIRNRDISRLTNKLAESIDDSTYLGRYVKNLNNVPGVISTDEQLFERAMQKDQVNSQILTAVKESAMDCSLYEHKDENLACYSFGKVRTNAFGSFPTLEQEMAQRGVEETKKQKVSYREYLYKGNKYVQNKKTYELYTYDDYEKAKKTRAMMYPIGKVIYKGKQENVVLY